ncbi:hypothetical protein D9758_016465 [Tetrapyrgos nigripes]|uniref:Uncharacterized protein n=1 Tax=Tetrapyrgos nigripes TaxID=182062 RepID=A0A8H5FPZ7_9AGAR|nr:hypothetical protein D9758_016465 [Tetrapyrgos nigripes]
MPHSSSHSPTRTKIRPAKRSNSLPPRFTDELNFNTLHNPNLSNNAAAAIAGSVKPETRRHQQLAVMEFAVWANDMGLHPDEVLPAPEAVLCEFAASFLGHLAGGTVKAKLSALKTWHTMLGFRWLRSDLLCKTLTGVDHQSPSSSHRPERPPVTRDMMQSLHSTWSTSNHGDHKCALSRSKYSLLGQLQLSEIFSHLFDPTKHPHVQDVTELPPPTPNSKHGPLAMFLPSTKTSVSRGNHAHIHTYHGSLNATKATHIHVCHNNLSPNDPLMSYRDKKGKLKVMTKSYFLNLCNNIWKKEGYPRFTSHSFHTGAPPYFSRTV